MNDNDLLQLIGGIRQKRRDMSIVPDYVPAIEVRRRCPDMTRQQLNERLNRLYYAGRIKVHRTLNDKLIEPIWQDRKNKD